MKRITTILAIGTTALFFTGCGPGLPPEVPIPASKKVKNVNHKLTASNQNKIEKDYVAYRNNIVTGPFSATANLIEKANYEVKNFDIKKEKLYQCEITRMMGQPQSYFHKMFVISDNRQAGKEFSVGMNYNNVNDIKYFDSNIYVHKDGGYGMAIVEMSGLSVKSGLNYKCKLVKNTIFH